MICEIKCIDVELMFCMEHNQISNEFRGLIHAST